jgi:hypothetical protein
MAYNFIFKKSFISINAVSKVNIVLFPRHIYFVILSLTFSHPLFSLSDFLLSFLHFLTGLFQPISFRV